MNERMNEIEVWVGFAGAERPIRFQGLDQPPNNEQWHTWTLYKTPGGYRVLDVFDTTMTTKTKHTALSHELNGIELARRYPTLVNFAVTWGIIDAAETAYTPAPHEEVS